ncbi:oligopeptide transporter 2 [Vigna radiata var. radiata]|uniref:Oligopeptide transporter 2 n=1 Tax=Vigna radiata var. radiata TaxID=3916 RepID=A0A1S3U3Z2_VIGRR|nr:oligopeptide transporter 2 [Vigna radiata var. radiata]
MATIEIERERAESPKDATGDDDVSPIEEVRMVVSNEDNPNEPVWTFRMWFLGIMAVALLSFLNTFFGYRSQPLTVTMISVQVATLPIGRFMAKVLPRRKVRIRGREFSLNPGPFNRKEHVLISIFANAGAAFGNGSAYAVGIVDIIRAFYGRKISLLASWLLVSTTQVLGYGWAGIMKKYVVEPAQMWWPGTLVQVSLFRALHEKEGKRMSKEKFFIIALTCSFAWYVVPGYLFPTLSIISWVCWIFPHSVTAHQLGSGKNGLGLGSFSLDWTTIASFLGNPLVTPFFAIANVLAGYVLFIYLIIPIAYWGLHLYSANNFPIYSSNLFTSHGDDYNVTAIVNQKFEIDMQAYEKQGLVNLSVFFAISYGFGFAAIAASLTHVAIFNGREIYEQFRSSQSGKEDIHTRLMKKYKPIPNWWFHVTLLVSFLLALLLCTVMKDQVQMPWWGLIFAAGLALTFTLPISIITATTNQSPGLNIITEYIMGVILPGEPIANVCFKTYGYISMSQAVSFLSDFKLGHYMKIPPRSMFIVQVIGTLIAGTVDVGVAWWLLGSIKNICKQDLLPENSPWTCPGDHVFFDASVIWGLVGPRRIFGSLGKYQKLNWFFLIGAVGPVGIWALQKVFPKQHWISLIHLPVLLGATASMPPASTVNFNSWIVVGTIFNYFVFKYRKNWWKRYNYVLAAALDAGLAFMTVLIYFALLMEGKGIQWWGTDEHCPLAECPTAKGLIAEGCPVF